MFKKDYLLAVSLGLIVCLGLLILLSLSYNEILQFSSLKKQILFFCFGFGIYLFFSNLDWRIFNKYFVIFLYFSVLILLGLVLVFGSRIKGSAGWFNLGIFHFQPSELSKIILILILAKFLASKHLELWQFRNLFNTAVFVSLPVFLLILQPDLGGALILLSIWFFLILIAGIRLNQVILLVSIFIIASILIWNFVLKDYQRNRIINFLNPSVDPLGIGYNREQALIAIGSGKIFGKGLGWGTQTHLRFLPLAKTDFIFAALAEELGLFGSTLLLVCFFIFIYRLVYWANVFEDNFSKLFTVGFAFKILIEVFINVGMNIGLLPIIGIALPFVSLGGSHLLTDFFALGIIASRIKHPF
ncbi:MAG: rod shape-determining protein RodA [Minisyncoccia bacterium]